MSVPSEESAARVAAGVRAAAASARVDSQSRWLSPVASFMRTMIAGAAALVLLMAAATTAVVLLAARAGLETHRDTIAILHMLGSTDVQVARLFQRRIALDTVIGGAIGAVAAMVAIWAITRQLSGLGSRTGRRRGADAARLADPGGVADRCSRSSRRSPRGSRCCGG